MEGIYKTLKKFGLTENEAKVYLESLKKEETSPFELAKLTGIPRTTVYDVVMGLSLKGLIKLEQSDGFTKQQTKIQAKNPSILRDILRKKRKDLVSLELDILNFLPELKADFHRDKVNADFQFFPGIEGAKKVYMDKMEAETELPVYVWDIQMPMDIFGRKEMNQLVDWEINFKKNKKRNVKEIMALNDWTRHVMTYQVGRDPKYLETWEIRYLEDPSFEIYQRISIVGDYIRIICAKDKEVWGLKIQSPLLASSFRSIFQVTWQIAKPVTLDVVKSWGENELLIEERNKRRGCKR